MRTLRDHLKEHGRMPLGLERVKGKRPAPDGSERVRCVCGRRVWSDMIVRLDAEYRCDGCLERERTRLGLSVREMAQRINP